MADGELTDEELVTLAESVDNWQEHLPGSYIIPRFQGTVLGEHSHTYLTARKYQFFRTLGFDFSIKIYTDFVGSTYIGRGNKFFDRAKAVYEKAKESAPVNEKNERIARASKLRQMLGGNKK